MSLIKIGYDEIEIEHLFEHCKVSMLGLTSFVLGFRFKRLTGRNEVAISDADYKFYSPRHKYRRGTSISLANIPDIPVRL